MALKFKNGDSVTQVLPAAVTGTVARFVFDQTSGEISYIVASTDADGVVHERVFAEAALEASR
jgi:hypothetical protein